MGKEPAVSVPDTSPLDSTTRSMDPATFWRHHPGAAVLRLPTPTWRHRGNVNLPLLASTSSVDGTGPLDFPGAGPDATMDTFAFEARPGAKVRYVGVAALKGKVPEAFLIYFRHSVKEKDFQGEHKLLETGVGDYFIGRMQVCRQVLRSGKNVAVILPIAVGGAGEFASSQAFVEQCLTEISRELFPSLTTPLPLVLACNSDGIGELNKFVTSCPDLVKRVRAVYDFDGSFVLAQKGVTLAGIGSARVFRYNQGPQPAGASPGMGASPRHVPLPYPRWSKHFNFVPAWQTEPANPKTTAARRSQIVKEIQGYLHWFIPTCMLQHGLASTNGI
ncbi:hypothetical protein J421_4703 (plasmid) [Gemmatirosa kalamazoonensis]|jgi:hypothetical protein|uniref:Uncharacterized protein n=1 Tax=Gemmatirosa kalamazoonensis TaxID=861299 RepID=W0RRP3_9BACT|nr:hypothetical protein [Gemmatirosa kalamazoonensis]AHG92238.1 hypothetical protein J421_4703 [Gemmatirosa kalamazoonensis]